MRSTLQFRGTQNQGAATEMKQLKSLPTLALLLTTACWPLVATAQQAEPTATNVHQLSAFGALTGVYTGVSGGKNLGVSVGVDLALAPCRGMRPTLELRGLYPIDKGTIVSEKAGLGGLRLDFLLGHRVHPYGDFLFGRGKMNYESGGYNYNHFTYIVSTSYVYSPGAGFDYDLSDRLAIKVDGQMQRWGSVPTASGSVFSTVGSIGLVYRFGSREMP